MEECRSVDHCLSHDQQMVPLPKLSNAKRQARAYYYVLEISQACATATKNFTRMSWNPTVSHSGHGFSLHKPSSQQVLGADLQGPRDYRMCL